MNLELKLDVSQLPCFFEYTKIGALFRNTTNPVQDQRITESPVWLKSANTLIMKPIPLEAGALSRISSLQGLQGDAEQSSIENWD